MTVMDRTSGRGAQAPNSVEAGSVEPLMRQLRVLWFGLLIGQVLFTAMFVLMGGTVSKEPGPASRAGVFQLILGLVVLGAVVGHIVVERAFVSRLRARSTELKRSADPVLAAQADYRGFFVSRCGIVQGTALFAGVSYFVTGAAAVLLVPATSILWFLLNYPTEDRVRLQIRRAVESA